MIAFCRERLANFKVPRQVEFRDDLPRNPSGKVLKRLLQRRSAMTDGRDDPDADEVVRYERRGAGRRDHAEPAASTATRRTRR